MSTGKKKLFAGRGNPLPLGPTVHDAGVNLALFSRHAKNVKLVLQELETAGKTVEIELDPEINKTGDIWHICVNFDPEKFVYGFRLDGERQDGKYYDPSVIVLDPFCPRLLPSGWGEPKGFGTSAACLAGHSEFDWRGDRPLKTPLTKTIIYELHVRGFTVDKSSGVKQKGTFSGLTEKIPYLKELGITAVELMPVTEFDENDTVFFHPDTGVRLKNFWGYNPVSFFCVKSAYAADKVHYINEFKQMVRAFHQAGIEVILDIVFNHSGEGGYHGLTSSFRGIDNTVYYLLDKERYEYLNFSGCGNTLNCNHPVVRDLIRDALRYWVMEMHVDGFRFDLASILGRDQHGNVLPNPPMIEMIAEDPVLRDTKIIAEAWDAAGLYQVGSFSTDKRWAEWNGRYRDDVRAFFAGYSNSVSKIATRIAGSSDLYGPSCRGPLSSINFITSHDGFTLADLVSYEQKHNESNGEKNRDGDNHNISWNSGVEGDSRKKLINRLRIKRMKNFAAVLLFSQGVPMITAGDEFGRTQRGNNNSWSQDNRISWLDWSFIEKHSELLRFFKGCIRLRKLHPVFTRDEFFGHQEGEITWQALRVGAEDWSEDCHHLGFLLHGEYTGDDDFFILLNGHRQSDVEFEIPAILQGSKSAVWKKVIDTSRISPYDFVDYAAAESICSMTKLTVPAQTVIVLQAAASDMRCERKKKRLMI